MYIQDIALPSGCDRNKKRIKMIQNYSSRNSEKSSVNDDGQGWSGVDTRHAEDVSGK